MRIIELSQKVVIVGKWCWGDFFSSRVRWFVIRVRVKDGGGEAEVSEWQGDLG